MQLEARAKINLSLNVIGRRPDGFHEIDSVMQSVSLSDFVKLTEISSGIKVFCTNPLIPSDHTNTAYKAARVFFEKTGITKGIKIEIQKLVPEAAGLGGGSADAAAVLVGLNIMYKAKLSESDLKRLGEDVGSDIPFCIMGGTAHVQGRGELVEQIEPLPKSWFVLVTPQILISTAWAYKNFMPAWFSNPTTSLQLYNDLEKVVLPQYPEVEKVKKKLIELGSLQALMSGSGSSVFGLVDSEEKGQKILNIIRKKYPQSYLVASVDKGVVVRSF
ncbi:MAG: 4-(cytidine 5'-diphospho)-2-C-methyl-D-erythritol kinase [Candidatus Saganbacteria bacterium]|nr:4-(cytidine 5'-diphospho)-2-C-methyl-D-erythritol kinase [Candidatus Saganbacteria bacterium]